MYATLPKTHRTTVPRDDKPSEGTRPPVPLNWSREEIEKHFAQLNIKPQKRPVIPPAGVRGERNS